MSCYSGIIYWNMYRPTTLYANNDRRNNSKITPVIHIYSNNENKALELLVQGIIFINWQSRRAKTGCMFLTAVKNNRHIYRAKTWSFFYKYDQLFTFMDLLKCCTWSQIVCKRMLLRFSHIVDSIGPWNVWFTFIYEHSCIRENIMCYLYVYCDLTASGRTIFSKVMNCYGELLSQHCISQTMRHISGYATINLWYVMPLKRIYNLQWNVWLLKLFFTSLVCSVQTIQQGLNY